MDALERELTYTTRVVPGEIIAGRCPPKEGPRHVNSKRQKHKKYSIKKYAKNLEIIFGFSYVTAFFLHVFVKQIKRNKSIINELKKCKYVDGVEFAKLNSASQSQ